MSFPTLHCSAMVEANWLELGAFWSLYRYGEYGVVHAWLLTHVAQRQGSISNRASNWYVLTGCELDQEDVKNDKINNP
jgi:hypothetical protein